jgi:multidrug resistance efflux pump
MYAEFDGVIFNLSVHENSIVTSSQIIAQVVPKDEPVEVRL